MKRRVLCLDCDGVIFDVVNMMKSIISRLNYICSDEFKTKVIDRLYQNNELELYNRYSIIQKITRDEVLEEVNDLYKGKIDYNKIYVIENTYPGVIELIKKIYDSGYFDKIYITTHVNSEKEIIAKKKFFAKYLPMVEVRCYYFHEMPYDHNKDNYFQNANRTRSNKPKLFFEDTHENPKFTHFVDDSEVICNEARALGAKATHRYPEDDNPCGVFYKMLEDNIEYIDDNSKKLSKLYH